MDGPPERATFNELVEWRKSVRDPRFVAYEDKYRARRLAKGLGCAVPDLYHVTTDPATIPFARLPAAYVVKPTHLANSLGVLLMHDGIELTEEKPYSDAQIIARMSRMLRKRHLEEEWAVCQIEPAILVEQLLPDERGVVGRMGGNYKCFVFGGRLEYILYNQGNWRYYGCRNEQSPHRFYSRDWQPLDFLDTAKKRIAGVMAPPVHLARLIADAERICAGFDFARADFYLTPGGPVFGEYSLYPNSGRLPVVPEADALLGALWLGALRSAQAASGGQSG